MAGNKQRTWSKDPIAGESVTYLQVAGEEFERGYGISHISTVIKHFGFIFSCVYKLYYENKRLSSQIKKLQDRLDDLEERVSMDGGS
jgi:hypothetical protein